MPPLSGSTVAAILGASGVAQAGASAAGGKKGAAAANNAAQLQYQASLASLGLQQGIRAENVAAINPFYNFGVSSIGALQGALGDLTRSTPTNLAPFTFDPASIYGPNGLSSVPGFQFTLDQATKYAQNSGTAMGLGRSPSTALAVGNAATQNAISNAWLPAFNTASSQYTTNTNTMLASRQMYLQQLAQIYNMMQGGVQVGENALGALTNTNLQTGAGMVNATNQGAAALASGQVGAANALTAGLQGVGNAAGNTASTLALLNAYGGGLGFNPSQGSTIDTTQLPYPNVNPQGTGPA
jgi:hypothetical protein